MWQTSVEKGRRVVHVALVGCSIMILIGIARFSIETAADRIAVCDELHELRTRLFANQGDGDALKQIVKRLHGRWDFAAVNAAYELGELRERGQIAVTELIWALDCGRQGVERQAALSLGKIGPVASQAVPALTRKFKTTRSTDTNYFCAEALDRIQPIFKTESSGTPVEADKEK